MRVKRLLATCLCALAFPAAALAWGGSYPTGDTYGSSVTIGVSDAYPVDETLPQSWATYLGTLVHGPELARLTLDLMPLSEVQGQCGEQALACYDPHSETIYASPEDQLDSPPAKEILAHEYGHHVAANRADAPWSAEDYGTKRWSSYENICAKAAGGTASPGDEGVNYFQNSGEAFAESYRVLNLQKLGLPSSGWDIVDPSFFPDANALTLLEEDVTAPWTGPTASKLHGSFGTGVVRAFSVKTQLDGSLTARLVSPTTSKMRLALYNEGTLVLRGTTIRYQICGERTLMLKVERISGRGAFTVNLSKP